MTPPLAALLIRKARRKPALEIPKMDFYRNFYDVEDYEIESIETTTVVHLDRRVLAYREGNTYYQIDDRETTSVI